MGMYNSEPMKDVLGEMSDTSNSMRGIIRKLESGGVTWSAYRWWELVMFYSWKYPVPSLHHWNTLETKTMKNLIFICASTSYIDY